MPIYRGRSHFEKAMCWLTAVSALGLVASITALSFASRIIQ